MPDIEHAARENLAVVLDTDAEADAFDLDRDLVDGYGLTSLNKVLFLTALCDDTGVSLSHFTEHDVARMRTLRDVIEALTRHAGSAATR
jgi:acyl carrier protein